MEEAEVARKGGLVEVMLSEHGMGRDLVRKIALGVERYEGGVEGAVKEIIENTRSYIQAHFLKPLQELLDSSM